MWNSWNASVGVGKKRDPKKRTPRCFTWGYQCQSRDGGPDQLTPEEEGTQRSRGDRELKDA